MKMLHVHLKFRKRRFKKFFSQLGYIQSYVPFVYFFGKWPFLYDSLRIYIIMQTCMMRDYLVGKKIEYTLPHKVRYQYSTYKCVMMLSIRFFVSHRQAACRADILLKCITLFSFVVKHSERMPPRWKSEQSRKGGCHFCNTPLMFIVGLYYPFSIFFVLV